ncbi:MULTISPECIES: TraB/GumN family protein [Pseudoalteromonas]|uniref:TraB/GumN family protein n=1 Tax=Pseudoalteromonas TaxID=53246 RepID=UPI0002ED2A31|nr:MULTISPECIES: TraB/GumN family protein [Pseudoalteromonas]MCF6145871.1 hypothetical protein [Pseudoalteromonas mariniglutinosa NCIMB 1770]TMN70345.1 TraB/GumN family protein [Pseudoalteromonas sp. S1727]BDF95687.1 conjugative transfer protein GumN [Pseudoalteromonas sp. KAN5]
MINFSKNLISKSLLIGCSLLSLSVAAQTSVWQVSKGDDKVYIGGTLHILPSNQMPLPAEFEFAYKQSDTVILEAKMPDPADSQAQMTMLQTLSYKNGETLSEKLSPEVKAQLETKLAQFGVSLNELNSFRPFMVSVILMSMELQKQQLIGDGVDAYFANRASSDQKTQQYLETLEFQLQLFKEMGENSEDKFIQSNLTQLDDYAELFDGMMKAWRSGDTESLNELVILPMRKEDPATFDKLLKARNHNWLPQVKAMFGNNQQELVLVGAAHLAGEHNLLALLAEEGYSITQLDIAGEQ